MRKYWLKIPVMYRGLVLLGLVALTAFILGAILG
jgi:hypothetical protein